MGWLRRMLGWEPRPTRRPYAQQRTPADTSGFKRSRLREPQDVFTPTQPKRKARQLTGRQAEMNRILRALEEDRAHVVLYSERGRGKTSLSNMVVEALRRRSVVVARTTCEADSDFDSLLRGLVRSLPPSLLAARDPTGTGDEGCEAALPARTLRPEDMLSIPTRLACRTLVCLVDEFDRVRNERTRTQLADAIKQLSDREVPLLFLVVGVSENLDEILGQHQSIQRSVLGVHLPLFTDRDVAQLISKGGAETGFSFLPDAVARIAVLARGMPYMAQLLGLRLTQAAADRGSMDVTEGDFRTAVDRLVMDVSPTVGAAYAALTDRGRDEATVAALRRIATAPQDEWGRLEVEPQTGGGVLVGGRSVAAAIWRKLEAAHLLKAANHGYGLAVFAQRALMHHTLLLTAQEALLADDPSRGSARFEVSGPETRTSQHRIGA